MNQIKVEYLLFIFLMLVIVMLFLCNRHERNEYEKVYNQMSNFANTVYEENAEDDDDDEDEDDDEDDEE